MVPNSGISYLGCYREGSSRMLPALLLQKPHGSHVTVRDCAAAAVSGGYAIFGIQVCINAV